jgi:hypothetical protein
MDEVIRRLEEELILFEQNQKEKKDYGTLGYAVNGVPVVPVEGRPHLFHVTMNDGTMMELPHHGKVSPTYNLPVEVHYDAETGKPYIFGPDQDKLVRFLEKLGSLAGVGWHSHHRGSGQEFPIDLRLFLQLSARIVGGLVLEIQPGWYFHTEGMSYLPRTTIDLSDYAPTQVSYKCWVVVGIDLTTEEHDVIIQAGTPVPSMVELSPADILEIPFTDLGYMPLFAVRLYQNRPQINDIDIEALYNVAGLVSSFRVESIVTAEGEVVVDGVSGEVVVGF